MIFIRPIVKISREIINIKINKTYVAVKIKIINLIVILVVICSRILIKIYLFNKNILKEIVEKFPLENSVELKSLSFR